ncbi:MAG: hypothetical protein ACI4MA_00125 [Treponema sp.]
MKKIFMTFIAAVIFAGSIFAGGGGYFEMTAFRILHTLLWI